MTKRSKRWAILVGTNLLAISMSAACGVINPLVQVPSGTDPGTAPLAGASTSDVQTGAVATSTPAAGRVVGGLRPIAVKRDAITETLPLDGLVVARQQERIYFTGRANVAAVMVQPGDAVKQGDMLIELEAPHHVSAAEVNSRLVDARAKLQAAEASQADAEAHDAVQQQSAAQRAAIAQRQQQQVVTDAAAGVQRAQDNLSTVQAGASTADRQAAENGIESAQALLQKAQDAQDKLTSGPDATTIRAAQRDVTNSQIALSKAQAGLDALTRGPDAAALRDAQAAEQRAQVQLQVAQASKIDPKADPTIARLQHDQSIQDAQLAVQGAQDYLTRLQQPPADVDVRAARQVLQDAQDALTTAQDTLALLEAGPDDATLNIAQTAVDKAQQGLNLATVHATEVNSHPTRSELASAQDQLRKAQVALDNANRTASTPTDAGTSGSGNTQYLQQILESQAEIAYLEDTLSKTHLLAPYDGTVVSVTTKSGMIITSTVPLLTLARPGPPIVRVDLTDDQAGRLSVGQVAVAQFDNGTPDPTTLPAKVTTVTPTSPDGSTSASVDLQVNWPEGPPPPFGTPAQVNVTTQQKQDVLVIPRSAVHQAGARATVEVQDGTLRHIVNVQVGITNATSVEILSGLTEGQTVLVQAS